MNVSSDLSSLRPSNGYGSVVSDFKRTEISMPAKNSLLNPSIHNTTKEPMANATASYPYFTRPYNLNKGFLVKNYNEGTILFINTWVEEEDHGVSTLKQVLSLADLNLMLHTFGDTNKWKEQQWDKCHPSKKDDGGDIDIMDVKNCWEFLGIVRNNDTGGGDFFGARLNSQRLLNVDVRGKSRVDNIWSWGFNRQGVANQQLGVKNVRQGDMLYLHFDTASGQYYGVTNNKNSTPVANNDDIKIGYVFMRPIKRQNLVRKPERLREHDFVSRFSKLDVFLNV